jgi:hypothetical protein
MAKVSLPVRQIKYRNWLRAFQTWIDDRNYVHMPNIHNAALAIEELKTGKFLGVEVGAFYTYSSIIVDSVTKNQPGNLAKFVAELAKVSTNVFATRDGLIGKIIGHIHGIPQQLPFVIKLGVIGLGDDDFAVEAINETLDINLTKGEDGKWTLKVFGESGQKNIDFDFTKAERFIVNIERKSNEPPAYRILDKAIKTMPKKKTFEVRQGIIEEIEEKDLPERLKKKDEL